MPLAIKATADFSRGVGRHAEPFVAKSDLFTGWDFKDFSTWKQGVVAGQTATAKRQNGTTTEDSDAPFSQSLDRMGLTMTPEGYITYNVSIPPFSNSIGPGRTIMAMWNTPEHLQLGGGGTLFCQTFGATGYAVRSTHQVNPVDFIGGAVQIANEISRRIVKAGANAALVFMRANGDGTWTLDYPTYRLSFDYTDAEMGASDPVVVWSGSLAGPIRSGNSHPTSGAYKVPLTLYQCAIWNRALTDQEVAEQYQRMCLRFPGLLI